jgi:hypothetical protein
VARFARMCRSCDGLPPRRGPLVGVGMGSVLLGEIRQPNQYCSAWY